MAPIVVGLVVGALGRLLIPGMGPSGFFITILLGLSGSVMGAILGNWLNFYRHPDQTLAILFEAAGALLLLGLYRGILALRPRRTW